jgi:hypothetical protein
MCLLLMGASIKDDDVRRLTLTCIAHSFPVLDNTPQGTYHVGEGLAGANKHSVRPDQRGCQILDRVTCYLVRDPENDTQLESRLET